MLPECNRLRRARDFQAVYRRGRSQANTFLVLYARQNRSEFVRIGYSIGKKVGGAVQRNRAKRRMREICRAALPGIRRGFDLIFVGRAPMRDADFDALRDSAEGLMAQLGVASFGQR